MSQNTRIKNPAMKELKISNQSNKFSGVAAGYKT